MPGRIVKVIHQDITAVSTEAVFVGFFEDIRPLKGIAGELDWLLCGALSRLLLSGKLHGGLGDVALLTSRGKITAPKIFMVGCGSMQHLSYESLQSAACTAVTTALHAGIMNIVLEYFPPASFPYDQGISAIRDGLHAGFDGRGYEVSLLARNTDVYDNLSRFMK